MIENILYDESKKAIQLKSRQQLLYNILVEKDNLIGDMYYGALIALSNNFNPDYIAQAAHSIRELMEKLPRLIDVPIDVSRLTLKNQVNNVNVIWKKCKKNSICINNGNWNGVIDRHLNNLLTKLESFFCWVEKYMPERKFETSRMLRQLDPSDIQLPEIIYKREVDNWFDIKDYFTCLSHHNKESDIEEFNQWLYSLERFLLNILKPRTGETLETIDKIIAQDE